VFGSDGEKDPPTLEDLQIARKKRDLVAVKSSTSSSKKQKQSENGEKIKTVETVPGIHTAPYLLSFVEAQNEIDAVSMAALIQYFLLLT
jgi:hypothetical protein